MQLNASDYYPDIDRQPDPVIDLQSPNAKSSPSTEDLHTRYGHRCGRAKHLELHSHRLYGEKTRSLKGG